MNDKFLKDILAIMRYAYEGCDSKTPLNKDEWFGTEELGGIRDHIISMLRDEKKRAYVGGYVNGAIKAFEDARKDPTAWFSLDDCNIGAERAWNKWEAER